MAPGVSEIKGIDRAKFESDTVIVIWLSFGTHKKDKFSVH